MNLSGTFLNAMTVAFRIVAGISFFIGTTLTHSKLLITVLVAGTLLSIGWALEAAERYWSLQGKVK